MTNGEKFKSIFPNIIKYRNILIDNSGALQKNILFDNTWWDAEYKEPSNSRKPNLSESENCKMTDIELVIKMPREYYENLLKNYSLSSEAIPIVSLAIATGTILPKGHGRLKDVDGLDITTITTDDYSGNEMLDVVLKEDIENALTIIEADKAESEE